jgi:hypothetical protein
MLVTMSNIVNATSSSLMTQPTNILNKSPSGLINSNQSSLRLLTGSHLTNGPVNGGVVPPALTSTSMTSLNVASQNGVSSTLSNAVVSATVGLNGHGHNNSSNNLLSTSASPQSLSNNNQGGGGSNSSSNQNTPLLQVNGSNPATLAFYLANPHLLNSAALHSTNFPTATAPTTLATTPNVFKEPFSMHGEKKNGKEGVGNLLQVVRNLILGLVFWNTKKVLFNTKNGTHKRKKLVVMIINILKAVFFVKNSLIWYFSKPKRNNKITHKNQKEKLTKICNFIFTTVLLN